MSLRKKSAFLVAIIGVIFYCPTLSVAQKGGVLSTQYLFPANGAVAITREASLIIRPGDYLNPASINQNLITVKGSFSGIHTGKLSLSDDRKTMIFKPTTLFTYTERVAVTLRTGIITITGKKIDSIYYTFTIQSQPKGKTLMLAQKPSAGNGAPDLDNAMNPQGSPFASFSSIGSYVNFPKLTPTTIDNPSPGKIFFASYHSTTFPTDDLSYLAIVDDSGSPAFLKSGTSEMTDFKVNANGLLTYYDAGKGMFFAMDSTYKIVDTFWCVNGYYADMHDIELLPHGHVLLMAYDTEQDVDLSQWIYGANSKAQVVGVVVQELDSMRNAVFNWRSFDSGGYVPSDMIEDPSNFQSDYIDEVHANSIQLDRDGNILLSARHLDEVTKISHETGKILWRWGGKHNEFTLLGDTLWFSHQHSVRRIDNGNIVMMDNGNDHRYHDPNAYFFSRACEYELDEVARTAKLVWQFGGRPHDMSEFMGYVQRLPSGNTFIAWGGTNSPAITEVRPDGSVAYELNIAFPYFTYRAYRFPWDRPTCIKVASSAVPSNDPLSIHLSEAFPNPSTASTRVILQLPTETYADVRIYDALGNESATLANGILTKGAHSLTFDATGLSSGIYRCVARAGETTMIKQIVISH